MAFIRSNAGEATAAAGEADATAAGTRAKVAKTPADASTSPSHGAARAATHHGEAPKACIPLPAIEDDVKLCTKDAREQRPSNSDDGKTGQPFASLDQLVQVAVDPPRVAALGVAVVSVRAFRHVGAFARESVVRVG